ncbi:hypothetical protein [Candidatus Pantoea formicae]|uniref:hypothetical protein n=1 Tax=Candidatus Pantoea formicae TaxID=2608355 RepID=UPI003EDADB3B
MHDKHDVLDGILNVLFGIFFVVLSISFEHWIIGSLVWGGLGYLLFSAINARARSDAGAVFSGVTAIMCACLFYFGVFAGFIFVLKTVWNNV